MDKKSKNLSAMEAELVGTTGRGVRLETLPYIGQKIFCNILKPDPETELNMSLTSMKSKASCT